MPPLENYTITKALSNWDGWRDVLRECGITFDIELVVDDTWNLAGGIRPTPIYGSPEYTFSFDVSIDTQRLWRHKGGTLYGSFISHHGESPSMRYVGSFMFVDNYEAMRQFDELYALWYKQYFGDHVWLLVGKSDGYDNFTKLTMVDPFFNGGYVPYPTIPFFPTYPDPAMSIIGSLNYDSLSFTFGVFDGSLANGVGTGDELFGHFFDLGKHAFLIGEVDWNWTVCKNRTGCFEIGVWKHTSEFRKFNGRRKNGTEGFYLALQQYFFVQDHVVFKRSFGGFAIFSVADPAVIDVHYYSALGLRWDGFFCCRPFDIMGIAVGRAEFTDAPEAHFRKRCETAYEAFYSWRLQPGTFLRPDFQYVVHPGGRTLPDAYVFQLRLFIYF